MAYALGGRASEDLNFGKISTGALNDLEKVTKQAYAMVSFFGMSDKIGHISFYDSSGQSDYGFTKPYSEKTAELIDEEVNKLVAESYERAKQVLASNQKGLTELAELLLEKEVIFSEDLERIFGKRRADALREEREAETKKDEVNGNASQPAEEAKAADLASETLQSNHDENENKSAPADSEHKDKTDQN
jgi:cell division protease FtsH